ncbi:MAG TPA: hypothetical protein VKA15_08475 [Isosphaeraceae bacterium]|nr:hypothetical protein [Isosphaeraceae bacterium]
MSDATNLVSRPEMDLPARYPYNPSRKLLACAWAWGAFGLAVAVFARGFATLLGGLGIAGSVLGVLLGLLFTIRRHLFPRFLVIDEDGLWIPSGFMLTKPRRVVFAEVSDIWEAYLPGTLALCLKCHRKTFDLRSSLLADHKTYLTVGGYICSRIEGNFVSSPAVSRPEVEAPARYRYDPPWQMVATLWLLAAGAAVVTSAWGLPRWLVIIATSFVAGSGVLVAVRRYAFTRCLLLDKEGVWIPGGFLGTKLRRVVFAEISEVWDAFVPTAVLSLRSHGKTFRIHGALLPDARALEDVGQFICSRAKDCRIADRDVIAMLHRLHLVVWGLWTGALGLLLCYWRMFPSVPKLIILVILLAPSNIIFFITFFSRPPFGPLGLRRCMLVVISAYTLLAAGAEAGAFVFHFPPNRPELPIIARVCMYIGTISLLPIIRVYFILRQYQVATDIGEAPS